MKEGDCMFEVELEEKAKENGLAVMLAQMIKDNIEKNKWKEKDALSIKANISIYAVDSDVKVGISFNKKKCFIVDGEIFSPNIRIEANTVDLINLSRIKIVSPLHIPIIDKESFDLVRKLLKREIKLQFCIKDLKNLFHLIRLLSVYP
ncbi:MAG: hypothetical protein RMJ45_00455 [Candidatus Calescibacterium sp.]|nr:hypothetical protein [Candidatus Calescibacterium sp.]